MLDHPKAILGRTLARIIEIAFGPLRAAALF
jgi:hypothetical protein